jgi:hypothetical protein
MVGLILPAVLHIANRVEAAHVRGGAPTLR